MGAQKRRGSTNEGFALPSVVVVSLIMIAVVASVAYFMSVTRTALNTHHYEQLAKAASDAGSAMAQACIKKENYSATWSDAKPLRPNTDCNGNAVSGRSPYVLDQGSVRTTFTVKEPVEASGLQRIFSSGKASQIRTSDGAEWRSYEHQQVTQYGATLSFNTFTFGYDYNDFNHNDRRGAMFVTVDQFGVARTVGLNNYGQLGVGDSSNTVTPKRIQVGGEKVSRVYLNYLSAANKMFITTTSGKLYATGYNNHGMLGIGTNTDEYHTPQRVNLPGNASPVSVMTLTGTSYVLADNGKVYAMGLGKSGQLGIGTIWCIAGDPTCGDRNSPVQVQLPTYSASNPSTQPLTTSNNNVDSNFVGDGATAYIIMAGGQVYGWGLNSHSQLGDNTTTTALTPIKVGAFGNTAATRAKVLSFDGDTLYTLTENDSIYASGKNNTYGQGAGAPTQLVNLAEDRCLDNRGNGTTSGRTANIWNCNSSVPASQSIELTPEGQVRVHPNASTTLCLDNKGRKNELHNPVLWYNCNNSPAQVWQYNDNFQLVNPDTGKCLDKPGSKSGNGTELQLWNCSVNPNRQWRMQNVVTPQEIPAPKSSGGGFADVVTDQWSVITLTKSGEVWGAGSNSRGQLGTNGSEEIVPMLTKMILPSGRKAVSIAHGMRPYLDPKGPKNDVTNQHSMNNDTTISNTYAILDDGSVYGTGSNQFGQLGVCSNKASYVKKPIKMQLPSGVKAKEIRTGGGTTVILTTNGKVFTVGNNNTGQLGDGTTTNSCEPRANRYTNIVRPLVY